ncbi:hypothetical protein A3Q56_08397 [Intoshia linei]|uniref:Uncharacterized protein n=1 Tax=Intoshia linei TaxID=1819745 RepID=A0A177APE2_9BILA|nr:hypothetical protein A3Q56_08397 [Intoshia linei]
MLLYNSQGYSEVDRLACLNSSIVIGVTGTKAIMEDFLLFRNEHYNFLLYAMLKNKLENIESIEEYNIVAESRKKSTNMLSDLEVKREEKIRKNKYNSVMDHVFTTKTDFQSGCTYSGDDKHIVKTVTL